MTVARVAYVLLSLCCAAQSHEFSAPTATCSSPGCIADDGSHALELLQKTMEVDSQRVKPSHVKVEDATDMINQMKAKDETIEFLMKEPVLPKTRGSISDGEPRVFVVGPNKAATTTLHKLFLSMGRRSCHLYCNGQEWDVASHEKNASSPLWHLYNAFGDKGDHADYKWLDTAFPGSRFVLNTRAMQPWMLSSYDHVRRNREKYGCEPQGNSSSCKARAHGNSSHSSWIDNSDEGMAERLASAAAHQEEVMAYFDAHKERRQRFIVVDVAGWKPEEVMLALRWVMRPKLEELPTDTLLVSRGQLYVPSKAQDALHAAPHTDLSVHANANPRGHPKHSEEIVNRALRELVSCPESMWQDVLYAKCAAKLNRQN